MSTSCSGELTRVKKTCCGYSLEVPWQGASNGYPQHMFSWEKNNTNTFLFKKSTLSGSTRRDWLFMKYLDIIMLDPGVELNHEDEQTFALPWQTKQISMNFSVKKKRRKVF